MFGIVILPRSAGCQLSDIAIHFTVLDLLRCSTNVPDTLLVGWGYPVLWYLNKHSGFHMKYGCTKYTIYCGKSTWLHWSPRIAFKWSTVGWKNSTFYYVVFSRTATQQFHIKTEVRNLWQVPYMALGIERSRQDEVALGFEEQFREAWGVWWGGWEARRVVN